MNSKIKLPGLTLRLFVTLFITISSVSYLTAQNGNLKHFGNQSDTRYGNLTDCTDPLTIFRGGQAGFVDRKGDFVIAPKFDDAHSFINGRAAATMDDKWGIIDLQGNWLIRPKYKMISQQTKNLIIVEDKGGYKLINTEMGSTIAEYEKIKDFEEGLAPYMSGGIWGFMDYNGSIIIPPQFEAAYGFTDGLALVRKNDRQQYIDKTGQAVFQLKSDWSGGIFAEGLARVRVKDNLYGFINKKGKMVIAAKFRDAAIGFSEGFAGVYYQGRWGFIDKTGKFIVEPKYDDVAGFSDGLGSVELNGKSGFVDRTGRVVIPLIYDSQTTGLFECGSAEVELDGKSFFIDIDGKRISPYIK